MDSVNGNTALPVLGFPIRKSMDQSSFAAPHGLSQLVTSFFGAWCQGILPVLYFAWSFDQILKTNQVTFLQFPVEIVGFPIKILISSRYKQVCFPLLYLFVFSYYAVVRVRRKIEMILQNRTV